MPSAPRESPCDCVARCASSRSFRRYARRLPPMTMLASPEVRRAIKDSRGKCRSRWLGHHTGNYETAARTFSGQPSIGTRTAYGQNADIRGADTVADMDCLRTACGRGCGHGLDADMAGCGLDTTPDRIRTDRGCGHRRGHLPGQTADSPRPLRGRKNLVLTRSKACV
jgi:hypothetical protein